MAKNSNVQSQKQFRGGYVPDQPVDEFNRSFRKEPLSPSPQAQRARNGLNLGSQTQARPGLVGKQDRLKEPKSRGRK